MIRVGVLGNLGYAGLPLVLERLRRVAPALGLELAYEDELREMAGSDATLDRQFAATP